MNQFTYVKKITPSACAFLRSLAAIVDPETGEVIRPAAEPVPVMRIKGIVDEGFEETSEFGEFIRWIGRFQAQAFQRDGSLASFQSRNLIVPPIASDLIAEAFRTCKKETNAKGRTGVYYEPKSESDAANVEVVFDLWITPPKRDNAKGYEFSVRPIMAPDAVNPLDKIGGDNLPGFGAPALEGPQVHKAIDAPAPEVVPATVLVEHKTKKA